MGVLDELFNKRVVAPDGTVGDGINLRAGKKKIENRGPDTPLEEEPRHRLGADYGAGDGPRATPGDR